MASFIHTQDIVYPPLLIQIMEECWQHNHFERPSAKDIHGSISEYLHLVETDQRSSIYLDSFTLHPVNRVSASHCSDVGETGIEICAALCGPEVQGREPSTVLVSTIYNYEAEKSELELDVS